MSWTPIRNGRDLAFRATVVIVYLAFAVGIVLLGKMMFWPLIPVPKQPLVICAACGFVLGRLSK